MSTVKVAVLGTYRSGSSIVAAVLQTLGVDMGAPFREDSFEPTDLSGSLSRWWSEPHLVESESASNRVHLLRQWMEARRSSNAVGCKHPLLCLSAQEVLRAWGHSTKFVWVHRPLEEAIVSLENHKSWENSRQIQQKLYQAANNFFPRLNGLVVNFEDLISDPKYVVNRLVEFLAIAPSAESLASAIAIVRPPVTKLNTRANNSSDLPNTGANQLRLVATIIAHNSQAIIADAIKSVIDWVDQILLLDTGITDETLNVARACAGEKLQVRKFDWTGDFAEARNESLEWATQIGATWTCTVDTDERLNWDSDLTRPKLDTLLQSKSAAKVWLVKSGDGTYYKERFFKAGAGLIWQGRVHETLLGVCSKERGIIDQLQFTEIAKTLEDLTRKLNRDLIALREEVRQFPDSGRAWYYLGQTLANLNQHEGAIAAFDKSSLIRDSQEQAAWSCYMSAKSHAAMGLYEEAIERCGTGLSIHAYFPEIAWLSAWCWYQVGEYHQSIAWCHLAISLGMDVGIGQQSARLGFRDLLGWYEGPYDVLVHCYQKLGEEEKGLHARQASARASQRRSKTAGI